MLTFLTLLAFGFPVVGLITYAIWRNHTENDIQSHIPLTRDWYK